MKVSSTAQTIIDSHWICVDLLISDVNLGLTFLDLAETTSRAEDRARRIQEAQKAYETTLYFLTRVTPTEEQSEVLNRNLLTLKTRLLASGVGL